MCLGGHRAIWPRRGGVEWRHKNCTRLAPAGYRFRWSESIVSPQTDRQTDTDDVRAARTRRPTELHAVIEVAN
ncbi:hypothetical protein JYU34_013942 [Plutella xylostella]|uniref:Uncharacterized protein n=1 Tax=Plutella xylostella TaxID=51655 RepID=A0ABQ7QB12_PLUXY|nr:hypothetical protein JYU34_013942 [Plutella xylostella]